MSLKRITQSSDALFKRAESHFPGGVNSPVRAFKSVDTNPFIVKYGKGPYLFDVDDNQYIDYVLSFGPLVFGHTNPKISEAISTQVAKGVTFGVTSEPEILLAELIKELMPSIEKIRFVNSGTEAGMAAIRLARAYTKKEQIIKFSGCYHGHADSFLVKAGSGVATLSLPDSPGVLLQTANSTFTADFNNIESVKEIFQQNRDTIAALIVEPVVGNSGFILPDDGFLEELRELCNLNNSLLIFDEVMTGFRVHLGGAQTYYKVLPDLTMLGKVIGGGLPIGAFGGKKEIMNLIAPEGPVYQAGTLSGNPLSCIAGYTCLKAWKSEDFFWETEMLTTSLVEEINEIAKANNIPFIATSLGTMFGFFFNNNIVKSYDDALKSDSYKFKNFFNLILNEGIYFAPSQFEAAFTSYSHIGKPFDQTVKAFHKIFKEL